MTGYNKLQTEIATGRLTLPLLSLYACFYGGVSIHSWNELISFISCALTGYMMIEINTAFTLIRTRRCCTSACLGLSYRHVCFFIHSISPISFHRHLSLLCSNYFAATNPDRHQGTSFHSFFFIGLGSLAFPQLLYFAPLFYISMISFSFFVGKKHSLPDWLG